MPDKDDFDPMKEMGGGESEELSSQADIDALLAKAGMDSEAASEPLDGDIDVDALLARTAELGSEGSGGGDDLAKAMGAEGGGEPFQFEDFGAVQAGTPGAQNYELLTDVNLNLKVELGRCHKTLEEILKLGEGSVVELDKLAGDPLEILVNDRPVARGEVLVLNENFCVRITEILQAPDKMVKEAKLGELG